MLREARGEYRACSMRNMLLIAGIFHRFDEGRSYIIGSDGRHRGEGGGGGAVACTSKWGSTL